MSIRKPSTFSGSQDVEPYGSRNADAPRAQAHGVKKVLGKRIFRFIAGALTLGAIAVFILTMIETLWYAPDTEIAAPQMQKVEFISSGDYPARLRIPVIGIHAAVQQVGINAKGNMVAPNNFTDVGWYKYGTPPGFRGSAVVAGHVDNGLSLAGVFKHLNELKIGDDLYVEKKDGTEVHFRVTEIQRYPYTKVPLDILFTRNDLPRLNLITCEGSWVQGERTYDQRLVIYSERVE